MSKQIEDYKVSFLRSLTDEDYKIVGLLNRIDECTETVRGEYMLSMKDMPKPIKIKGIDNNIYFISKNNILVEYMCQIKNGKFELKTITDQALKRYETNYAD